MNPSSKAARERRRAAAAARVHKQGSKALPEWPPDKPRPTFATEAEEVRFLNSFSFARFWKAAASPAPAREAESLSSVVRLRLKESERRALATAARARGITVSELLRELIGGLSAPQPAMRIEPGPSAPIRSRDGREVLASFAHLRVVNSGGAQTRVRCWLNFARLGAPSVPLFPTEMPARWASAPLPFAGPSGEAQQYDPYLASLGHVADFARGEEHSVAVALKSASGDVVGWSPESYLTSERMKWRLPSEPLLVTARIRADGRDIVGQFVLDASATAQAFAVAESGTDILTAGEGEATLELHQYLQDPYRRLV